MHFVILLDWHPKGFSQHLCALIITHNSQKDHVKIVMAVDACSKGSPTGYIDYLFARV